MVIYYLVLVLHGTTSEYGLITANANRSGDGDLLLGVGASWNGDSVSQIDFRAGDDTSNKDNGQIMFYTQETSGGGLIERMRINEAGNIGMGEDEPNRAALHVRGDDSTTSIVAKFRNPSSNASSKAKIGLVAGYGDHNQDVEGHAYIGAERGSTGNKSSLIFETSNGSSIVEGLRVYTGQNVCVTSGSFGLGTSGSLGMHTKCIGPGFLGPGSNVTIAMGIAYAGGRVIAHAYKTSDASKQTSYFANFQARGTGNGNRSSEQTVTQNGGVNYSIGDAAQGFKMTNNESFTITYSLMIEIVGNVPF